MNRVGKWMELGDITLSEVTQTQQKLHMLTLVCGPQL